MRAVQKGSTMKAGGGGMVGGMGEGARPAVKGRREVGGLVGRGLRFEVTRE